MGKEIKLSSPHFSGNEILYSRLAIESSSISTHGEFLYRFERKFSQRLKTHEIVALNSGTSAIHLSLILLGVKEGDEVICQSFTFCATANPILYQGASPIFVDSEKETWNMDPELLHETILDRLAKGKKPKAIVVVHLFGMPAKMAEILRIASQYQIPVVEDAAEAVGSLYQNKYCGTLGKIGVYSFNGNKILSAGGGGAVLSGDVSIVQKAKFLAMQAKDDFPYYQHSEVGYNYRMNGLSASIALAQLEQLDLLVAKRRQINGNYRELLSGFCGISFQDGEEDSMSNYWLTTILIDPEITGFTNEDLLAELRKENIESRYLWKPLHLQPVFKDYLYFGGNTSESLFEKGLCLPSSVNLTLDDQARIGKVIKSLSVRAF